jgi:hypothetical protein
MDDNLRNLLIGISANIIFFMLGFALSHFLNWWKWKKRLEAIERTAREDEIAVCVRVGGNSQPISDVEKFLTEKRPDIKNLLVYSVSAEDGKDKLGEAKTAQRIIEDIFEGLRSYGEGQLTRLHFFPVGMLAYAPLTMATVSNWCPIVVYHYTNGTYKPIYEFSKESKNQTKRKFKPIKTWEVLKIEPKKI